MASITINVTIEGLVDSFGFPLDADDDDVHTILRTALADYAAREERNAEDVAEDREDYGSDFIDIADEHLKREAIARRILDALPAPPQQ